MIAAPHEWQRFLFGAEYEYHKDWVLKNHLNVERANTLAIRKSIPDHLYQLDNKNDLHPSSWMITLKRIIPQVIEVKYLCGGLIRLELLFPATTRKNKRQVVFRRSWEFTSKRKTLRWRGLLWVSFTSQHFCFSCSYNDAISPRPSLATVVVG